MGLGDLPNFGGPSYAQAFPITGLAGLMQGISQGVQLGKEFDLQERKMANDAGWRQQQAEQLRQYHEGELRNRADAIAAATQQHSDMLDYIKSQAKNAGNPVFDEEGKQMGVYDAKGHVVKLPGAGKPAVDPKSLHSAAAAFEAMDNVKNIGAGFLPESSIGGTMSIPKEMFNSIFQTSPENNMADKSGQAATLYAAAVNQGGGGRMTETEIHNMARAMGGHGIGETKSNIEKKHEQMKDELATKMGVSRQQIEDYRKSLKSGIQPGTIQDGFRYKGGDPASQSSWEAVK